MNCHAIRMLAVIAFAAIAGCAPSFTNHSPPQPSASTASPSAETPEPPPPEPTASVRRSSGTEPQSPAADPEASASTPSPTKQRKGQTLDELLLFFPSKYPDGNWKPEGLRFEDAWFSAADGTRLHGWYCPCDNARAVLLHAHGNGGNLSHRAWLMKYYQQELHVTAFIFDYRGYGRSEGTPTVDGILQDARAARTLLAKRAGVAEAQIVLAGHSLGGAVTVELAAQAGARGLVLESTFSSLRDVASHRYPKLAWLVPAGKLDSVTRIARYNGPLLQSHGDADRTIPYALGTKLFKAANEPKQFVRMAGGDHNDPPPAEYSRQLDRFISNLPERK